MSLRFLLGSEIGRRLLEAGILPPNAADVTIKFPVGRPVTLTCEIILTESQVQEIGRIFMSAKSAAAPTR